MLKTWLLPAALVAIAILVAVYIYSENTRYYLEAERIRGIVYKIDRKTGSMWMIVGERELPVGADPVEKGAVP